MARVTVMIASAILEWQFQSPTIAPESDRVDYRSGTAAEKIKLIHYAPLT
jgi:hypothetical protein